MGADHRYIRTAQDGPHPTTLPPDSPPVLAEVPVNKLILLDRREPNACSDRMLQAAEERGVQVLRSVPHERLEVADRVRFTPGTLTSLEEIKPQFLRLSYGNVDLIWATNADRSPLANLSVPRGKSVVLFLPVRTQLTPELKKILSSGLVAAVVFSPRTRFDTLDPNLRTLIYSSNGKSFRTDVDGAVQLTTDGQTVKFKTFRGGR